MQVKLIASRAQKARIDRRDDSAEFLVEAMHFVRLGGKMSFRERRMIAELKANDWYIKKGQVYVQQWCEMEGVKYCFYTLPHILRICIKYNIYGEQ